MRHPGRAGRCVFDLSVSGPLLGGSGGLGPLFRKQKQKGDNADIIPEGYMNPAFSGTHTNIPYGLAPLAPHPIPIYALQGVHGK